MNIHEVILRPLMTEKGNIGREMENLATFAVDTRANKHEIRRAVEGLFKCFGRRRFAPCGSRARNAGSGSTSVTEVNGRRRLSSWPKARRSNSSKDSEGSTNAGEELQAYVARSEKDERLRLRGYFREGIRSVLSSRDVSRRAAGGTLMAALRVGTAAAGTNGDSGASISVGTSRAYPREVASIEYDPNRSANIALLHYLDGEKRYIPGSQRTQGG